MILRLSKSEITDLMAALVDAESDRRGFMDALCGEHGEVPMRGNKRLWRSTMARIGRWNNLAAKIRKQRDK